MAILISFIQHRAKNRLFHEKNPANLIQKMMFLMILKAGLLFVFMVLYQKYAPVVWQQKQNYLALFLGLLCGLQWFKMKMLFQKL